MSWILRFLFLFLSVPMAHASDLILETVQTSDKIRFQGVNGQYGLANTGWMWSYLYKDLEFRRELEDNASSVQKAQAGYGWQINENDTLAVYASLGHLQKSNEDKNPLMGRLNYQKRIDKWSFALHAEKMTLAEVFRSTSLAGALLTDFRSKFNTSYRFSENWKSSIAFGHSRVSDANTGLFYDGSLMYGVSSGWPWIWLGYGFEGLNYKENRIGYWSPKNFFTHGPRLDSSFSLIGKFSGIFALNMNYYSEDGTSGDGYLGAAGIQWGQYDGNNVRLMYTKIRSGQSQSPWVYEGLQLTCTILSF